MPHVVVQTDPAFSGTENIILNICKENFLGKPKEYLQQLLANIDPEKNPDIKKYMTGLDASIKKFRQKEKNFSILSWLSAGATTIAGMALYGVIGSLLYPFILGAGIATLLISVYNKVNAEYEAEHTGYERTQRLNNFRCAKSHITVSLEAINDFEVKKIQLEKDFKDSSADSRAAALGLLYNQYSQSKAFEPKTPEMPHYFPSR